MTDYGVQPTGYVRKPLAVILQEIETEMITEFGSGVIQTPQSPLGQINGVVADLVAELDEKNLDLYQSYDPDQAEGMRLDMLGRIRLVDRQSQTDAEYRQAITNSRQSRVDVQDLNRAVQNIDGVTYSQVFVNETGEVTSSGLDRGSVAVAVIGGDDSEIAEAMRQYVVPGVNTFGNHYVTSVVDGFCRTLAVIRPTQTDVSFTINIRTQDDRNGCPPPSTVALKNYIVSEWAAQRINGMNPSFYTIRSIVESAFPTVEITSFIGMKGLVEYPINSEIPISFTEMAVISFDGITVISDD